ncbi:hypothetical protein PUR61_40685 [Streptomyces sp. BE20]|uniref:hypothetical protein n=1 Tax=Streptomycetaceae TaxID=2062 RepID=UPI002E75EEB3|nr:MULTISPECIES: hypothetical protein [unclassified Streptomyces]MED7949374.1 hypothetical protein [Streptomyces sp. BE303]MEE1828439.1 hypothetical protein [Streptomyces sp. BE20]
MSGPLRLVPDEAGPDWAEQTVQLRTLPPRGRRRPVLPEQRPEPAEDPLDLSPDPLDELAERLRDVCADAVHPYEIAAFLESDGLSDEQAALLYGRPDSFTVAAELFEKVERRYPGPSAEFANPWRADPWRCVVRGLVFALPGLGYLLGANLFAADRMRFGLPSGMLALSVATLASWAWNQALAHRSYAWLGRGRRRSAAACLAIGAPLGAVASATAGYVVGGPLGALCFAAGQSGYLAAATVLLVLGREKFLLLALAPSALGAGVVLAVDVPQVVRTAVLLASLGLAIGLAARELVRCRRSEPEPVPLRLPLVKEVPHLLFGLAVGTLTMIAGLGVTVHEAVRTGAAEGASASPTGPAMIALTLSLGLAEWLLFRYRAMAVAALRTSHTPIEFVRRTGGVLLGCLFIYLTTVAALDAAATVLWPGAPALGVPELGALLLLGGSLWLALLLNAFGLSWSTALICLAAAGAECAGLLTGVDPTLLQLIGCGASAALLTAIAGPVLGRTTKHR